MSPDADGFVNATVTITGAQYGAHDISAASNGADNNNFKKHGYHDAKNRVNVASEIVIVPSTASPGRSVVVYGFGFGNDNRGGKNDEQVRFRADGLDIGSVKGIVGSHGRFTFNLNIPAAIKSGNNLVGIPGGTIVMRAEGHSTGGGGAAEDSLTIIPMAKIKNPSAEVDGDILIEGYGFPANRPVLFYLDSSSNGSGVYVQAVATSNTANARGGLEAKVKSRAFENPHIARHVRWQVQGSSGSSTVGAGNTINTYTAKPSISTEPYTGRSGESIRVVGKGFTPNVAVSATVGTTSALWVSATVGTINGGGVSITPTNTGAFTARFNAPATATTGMTKINVGTASKDFIYSTPGGTRTLMVLDGASGGPGTTVHLRGYNYDSFEPVGRLRFDSNSGFTNPQLIRDADVWKEGSGGWQEIGGHISTDVNGVFEVKFKTPVNTPDSTGGTKYIDTENATEATPPSVTITSSIARNPRAVSPGSTVTITGNGYGGKLKLGKASVDGIGPLGDDIETNANGVFSATIKIPDKGEPGVYNRDAHLKVQNNNVHKDALQLRNAQEIIHMSPTSGGSGTVVRVEARGFWANDRVEVRFDGKHVSPYDILSSRVHSGDYVTADGTGNVKFYFKRSAFRRRRARFLGASIFRRRPEQESSFRRDPSKLHGWREHCGSPCERQGGRRCDGDGNRFWVQSKFDGDCRRRDHFADVPRECGRHFQCEVQGSGSSGRKALSDGERRV